MEQITIEQLLGPMGLLVGLIAFVVWYVRKTDSRESDYKNEIKSMDDKFETVRDRTYSHQEQNIDVLRGVTEAVKGVRDDVGKVHTKVEHIHSKVDTLHDEILRRGQ